MIDKRLSRQTATMPFMTVPRHGTKDINLLVATSFADLDVKDICLGALTRYLCNAIQKRVQNYEIFLIYANLF